MFLERAAIRHRSYVVRIYANSIAIRRQLVGVSVAPIGTIVHGREIVNSLPSGEVSVEGAYITLPKGTYIIEAYWQFPNTSADKCSTIINIKVRNGDGLPLGSTVMRNAEGWWTRQTSVSIATLNAQTVVATTAASYLARGECDSQIRAIRIA